MVPKVTLYVDTVSPFGYLAYQVLRSDPVFSKCEITYVPILLGGIMKACGNTPPLHIKNKDKWIDEQRIRLANAFHVPMKEKVPDGFPSSTLNIMRSLCALTVLHPGEEGQKYLIKALDSLFSAYWVDHQKTNDKDVLAGILEKNIGREDTKIVLEMAGKEGKEVLSKNTSRAIEDGAFGLPWFVATNEQGEKQTFWGVDHLGQVTAFLGLQKPDVGAWKSML